MVEKIFVVEGHTGEYSDGRSWPVVAYTNEDKAKERVVNASKRANEIFALGGSHFPYRVEGQKNEFDSNMDMDYTGTHYDYYEIELIRDDNGRHN